MSPPLVSFGGTGQPPLVLLLANGFPPASYRPLLAPLTTAHRVVALPPRPLWTPPPAPESAPSWETLGSDVVAGLRAHALDGVVLVGHSFGGVAALLAALDAPERVRGLILLDPTIFTPERLAAIDAARQQGSEERLPLVEGALRRRARFASVDEAFAYWRARPLFADWADDVLRLYTEGLTRPADDGDGVTLTWSPVWEAHYYRTVYTDTWRRIDALHHLTAKRAAEGTPLPILIVRGSASNTFFPDAAALVAERLPSAARVTLEGAGHLFPQAAPDETRTHIAAWLRAVVE